MPACQLHGCVIQQTEVFTGLPAATSQLVLIERQAVGQCEHQHEGVLGNTRSSIGCYVADFDIQALSSLQVNIVGACGHHADQTQIG